MSFYFWKWLLENFKWHRYLTIVAQNKRFGQCCTKECPHSTEWRLLTANTCTFYPGGSYQAVGTHWACFAGQGGPVKSLRTLEAARSQWQKVSWINSPGFLTFLWDSSEAHSIMFHGVPQQDWATTTHKASSLSNIPHWILSLLRLTSPHPVVSWNYFPKKLYSH